jgi:hypothetical protein
MELRSFGLKSIKVGDIPDDGSMSAMLVPVGLTLKDTATLKESEGTVTQVYAEEVSFAIENFKDIGALELDWTTLDYTPEQLLLVKGGEVVAGVWNAPLDVVYIEKSLQIITKRDVLFEIPRADIRSLINAKLAKNGLAQIDNKAVVLLPNKAALSPLSISKYLPPVVDAGPAQPALAAANGNLVGIATAYRGDIVTMLWTVDTKPPAAANPGITTPAVLATAITGLVVGVYKFKLTVTDSNGYSNSALVTVTRTA